MCVCVCGDKAVAKRVVVVVVVDQGLCIGLGEDLSVVLAGNGCLVSLTAFSFGGGGRPRGPAVQARPWVRKRLWRDTGGGNMTLQRWRSSLF